MSNMTVVWNTVAKGLSEISKTKFKIAVKLFTAVIVQAGTDKDYAYFRGETFETHCEVLQLDPIGVRNIIRAAWRYENETRI